MNNKKIVIANWKMNPDTRKESKKLFKGIKNVASKLRNTQVVVCPPYIYINDLVDLYKGHRISIGAQDVFHKNKGSFTGMVSAKMLQGSNINYVILGHSERRALGEGDVLINEKIKSALKAGLNIILCVGELKRDDQGEYFSFLKNQILSSLKDVSKNSLKNIVIAYEPVWAISSNNTSGQSETSNDLHQMTIFIKKVLSEKYNTNVSPTVLYGGSVNPKNIEDLMTNGNIRGVLVGGASLDAEKFNKILKIVDSI